MLYDIPAYIIIEQIRQQNKAEQISEKEKRVMTNRIKELSSNPMYLNNTTFENELNQKIVNDNEIIV